MASTSGGSGGGGSAGSFWQGALKKAAGAGKTLKIILKETVGPMGLIYVAADKLSNALMGAAANAKEMAKALAASEAGRKMEIQFTKLTGSAELAKKKVQELAKQAQTLPFSFEALGEASKAMMAMSNGAMKSAKDLRMVADVAVAAGVPIEQVAGAIGELKSATEGANFNRWGDGVGQAVMQLTSMGVIAQSTGKRLREMQEAGATGGEMWRLVQKDIERSEGAAAKLRGTLDGMRKQLENIEFEGVAEVGRIFEDSEKSALRTKIAVAEFRAEMDKLLAENFAPMTQAWAEIKESITKGTLAVLGTLAPLVKFLGTFAILINAYLYAALIKFGGGLALNAIKLVSWRAVLMTTGSALVKYTGFVNAASGAMMVLGTAAIFAAQKVAAVNAELKQKTEDFKEGTTGRAEIEDQLMQEGAAMRTEDDRSALLKKIREEKERAEEGIAEARENYEKAERRRKKIKVDFDASIDPKNPFAWLFGSLLLAPFLTPEMTAADEGSKTAAQDLMLREQHAENIQFIEEKILAVNNNQLAVEEQINRTLRDRQKVEEEIKKAKEQRSVDRAQGAAGMAAAQTVTEEAEQKLKEAEKFSATKGKDDRTLAEAQDELLRAEAGVQNAKTPEEKDEAEKKKDAALNKIGGIASDTTKNEATRISAKLTRIQALRDELKTKAVINEEDLEKDEDLKRRVKDAGGWQEISQANVQKLENQRQKVMEDNNVPQRLKELTAAQFQEQTKAEEAAASQAEIDAARKRLNLERMIMQIKMQGIEAKETEWQAAEKAADKEIERIKEGIAAVQEMNEARKAGNFEAENEAAIKVARLGVAGKSKEQLQNELTQADSAKKRREEERALSRRDTGRRAMLGALRVQEEYAPTDAARKEAQKMADALTETMRKESLASQYTQAGMEAPDAKNLAEKTAQQERLMTEIEREGSAPRMSSLAQVGGSAGYAGVVGGTEKKLDELRKVNEGMRDLLGKLNEKYDKGLALYLDQNKNDLSNQ
jgi:hypothetical protein